MTRRSVVTWALGFGLGVWGCGDDAGDRRDPGVGGLDGGDAGSLSELLDARTQSPGSDADVALRDGETSSPSSCVVPAETTPAFSGAAHVNGPIDYADTPPVGGSHNDCWARWRVYDQELADERWVHNLEHGGVVFLYHCPEGCEAELTQLKGFVTGRTQALLTPYAALPTRFALVSWGVRLSSECFDMARFQEFYRAHVGMAPEQIASDPPASCL
jgi:hypothetical protein